MTRQWIRWMPAAAMPAVIAAAVLAGPLQATATVKLPVRTPAQVMALMAGNTVHRLSGTLQETASLGLPQLPDLGQGSLGSATSSSPEAGSAPVQGGTGQTAGADSANPLTAATISQLVGFLTAPHTVRIYLDGAGNQRVQVLDKLAERDVVRHGTTVWSYNSAENTATESTLPNPSRPLAETPGQFEQSPASVAAGLIKNLDPSTSVGLGANTRVANRPAYVLQLLPRTGQTLIGKVSIAVDAATGLPLRVTVTARGQATPALGIGFSALTLAAPPASTFEFTPPPGTMVTRQAVPLRGLPRTAQLPGQSAVPIPQAATHKAVTPKVTTSGAGWATIAHAPAGSVPSALDSSPALSELLQPVAGGHALSTSLFNVLITPDGALFAGAVPLAALEQAAAAK